MKPKTSGGKHRLNKVPDAKLADAALNAAYSIRTLHEVERRNDDLHSAAGAHGVEWGNGKACSRYNRCGNLACPICRRRAQLKLMADYAGVFDDINNRKGSQ